MNRVFRKFHLNSLRAQQIRRHSTASTPLERLLLQNIKATGPINVASYMQFCLAHPTHGYYMKQDPFGVAGDFITSPEITQMFGELIAIWFMSALETAFHGNSQKPNLRLVELGPGRGTLTADILRTMTGPLAKRTGLGPLTSVHLVETSKALQEKQQATLADYSQSPISISWHADIDDVPRQTGERTLIIANEFFDALPIHVFEKENDGWHEIFVDAAPPNGVTLHPQPHDGLAPTQTLRFAKGRQVTPVPFITSNPRFSSLPLGSRIEYSRASVGVMRSIAELMADGGLGLVIDYGAEHAFSSSLRGVRRHAIVEPFTTPGDCDLTANVDFATLRDAIRDIPGGLSVCLDNGVSIDHESSPGPRTCISTDVPTQDGIRDTYFGAHAFSTERRPKTRDPASWTAPH